MSLGFKPFSRRWDLFDDDTSRLLRKYFTGGPFKTNDVTREWIKNVNGAVNYDRKRNRTYPEFWARLRDKDMRTIDLGDGEFGNYKMSWGESDGKYYVYPEIQVVDGELVDLGDNAFTHALKSGNYVIAPSSDVADDFTKNYKAYTQYFGGPWQKSTNEDYSSDVVTNGYLSDELLNKITGFTKSYETYKAKPYILETKKKDGTIVRQELIGYGIADKNIIEKYRKTGIPEDVAAKYVFDELKRLDKVFADNVKNYKNLPDNVRLAVIETAYNTSGESFWANSPKFSGLVDSGVVDPVKLVVELDHSKDAEGWLGARSAARRAIALGKYDWDWQYVDKYGRHTSNGEKYKGVKDYLDSPYLGVY